MKILIIRHGDPDYENDTLTERGRREAALLAERIAPLGVKAFYVSPLGRAKDTARYTLDKAGAEAEVLPWLTEFDNLVRIGEPPRLPWDMYPEDWTAVPEYYDKDKWYSVPIMKRAGMEAGLRTVWDGMDAVLANHGYRRDGGLYRAERPNKDVIAFFCHFGVGCVMVGHLLGISPMILWHGLMAAPTSVTTASSEERKEGAAFFRISEYGDVSHLRQGGMEPAFSGRFCEIFSDREQRH